MCRVLLAVQKRINRSGYRTIKETFFSYMNDGITEKSRSISKSKYQEAKMCFWNYNDETNEIIRYNKEED